MEKSYDTLRFELINPQEEKEPWARDLSPDCDPAVRIYVNDKERGFPKIRYGALLNHSSGERIFSTTHLTV